MTFFALLALLVLTFHPAGHRHADTSARYLHPLEGAARAALAAMEEAPVCPVGVGPLSFAFGSPIGSPTRTRPLL